jgi:ribosomal protein S18
MTKGEIVGMFSDRGKVCVFVIDGKDHDQQHNDDRMARSEAKIHFGYQKLNSISEFQILGVGSVETLHHRNSEMPKCETPNLTPFQSFEYQELEVSKHFITKMLKHRNAKRRNKTIDLTPFWSFGYRELEVLKHFITEMSKCRNVKRRNTGSLI